MSFSEIIASGTKKAFSLVSPPRFENEHSQVKSPEKKPALKFRSCENCTFNFNINL